MRARTITRCFVALSGALGIASGAFAGPVGPGPNIGFDFNGDGKADIAREQAAQVLTTLLDGTMSIGSGNYANGGGTLLLGAVGRMNNDANYDLVLQSGSTDKVSFTNSTGTGEASNLFIGNGGGAWQVVDAADVNGDGVDEIIWEGTGAAVGVIRIGDISTGSPVFSYISTGGGIWTYAFSADVNGDGKADLVEIGTGAATGFARANLSGGATTVYYGEGGGAWTPVAAGDTNGDGTADLVDNGSGLATGFYRVRLTDTTGNTMGSAGFLPNAGGSFAIRAMADFNNDGKADLAEQGTTTNRITYLNGVAATGSPLFLPNGGGAVQIKRAGDTNADGYFDLMSQITSTGGVRITTLGPSGASVDLGPNGTLF